MDLWFVQIIHVFKINFNVYNHQFSIQLKWVVVVHKVSDLKMENAMAVSIHNNFKIVVRYKCFSVLQHFNV